MLAEQHALIAGVDNDGVLQQVVILQVVDDTLQVVVDALDAAQVLPDVQLIGVMRNFSVGKVVPAGKSLDLPPVVPGQVAFRPLGRDRRAYDADERVVLSAGRNRAEMRAGLIVEINRLGNVRVLEIVLVPLGVDKHVVRRLEMVHEEERLALVAAVIQPVEGDIRKHVGRMSFCIDDLDISRQRTVETNSPHGASLAGVHYGIHVSSLAGYHREVVEVLRRILEVPLADDGGGVSGLLHFPRQVILLARQRAVQVIHAVAVRVLPRHDACPARRADGVRAEGVVEHHALAGKRIEIRRRIELRQPKAVGADGSRAMVVGHDEKDVGPALRRRDQGAAAPKKDKESDNPHKSCMCPVRRRVVMHSIFSKPFVHNSVEPARLALYSQSTEFSIPDALDSTRLVAMPE